MTFACNRSKLGPGVLQPGSAVMMQDDREDRSGNLKLC